MYMLYFWQMVLFVSLGVCFGLYAADHLD